MRYSLTFYQKICQSIGVIMEEVGLLKKPFFYCQRMPFTCGPACVNYLERLRGRSTLELEIASKISNLDGTDTDDVIKYLKARDYQVDKKEVELCDLYDQLKKPLIALVVSTRIITPT